MQSPEALSLGSDRPIRYLPQPSAKGLIVEETPPDPVGSWADCWGFPQLAVLLEDFSSTTQPVIFHMIFILLLAAVIVIR